MSQNCQGPSSSRDARWASAPRGVRAVLGLRRSLEPQPALGVPPPRPRPPWPASEPVPACVPSACTSTTGSRTCAELLVPPRPPKLESRVQVPGESSRNDSSQRKTRERSQGPWSPRHQRWGSASHMGPAAHPPQTSSCAEGQPAGLFSPEAQLWVRTQPRPRRPRALRGEALP